MYALDWQEVYERLKGAPKGLLYGIPRGGAIVAGISHRATEVIEDCDYIVDDILDSGKTLKFYGQTYDKPVWPLVNKPGEGIKDWVRFPWEPLDPHADLEDTVIRQLEFIGEDPTREGLRETPRRVISALKEFTEGYRQDPSEILGKTFEEPYDEMVVVREIEFSSLCEHHLLPFMGHATVAYIPKTRVVGLSKIARLVHCFAKRLQIQERMTQQIANAITEALDPQGVAVMIRSKHLCMTLRGVENNGQMVTSCLLGFFRDKQETRAEFLRFCS